MVLKCLVATALLTPACSKDGPDPDQPASDGVCRTQPCFTQLRGITRAHDEHQYCFVRADTPGSVECRFIQRPGMKKVSMPQPDQLIGAYAITQDQVCVIEAKTAGLYCASLDDVEFSHSGNQAKLTEIRAGRGYFCALTKESELYCWGDNEMGQLGVEPGLDPVHAGDESLVPFDLAPDQKEAKSVVSDRRVEAFSLGYAHGCAVLGRTKQAQIREIWCWGANACQQSGTHAGSPTHEADCERWRKSKAPAARPPHSGAPTPFETMSHIMTIVRSDEVLSAMAGPNAEQKDIDDYASANGIVVSDKAIELLAGYSSTCLLLSDDSTSTLECRGLIRDFQPNGPDVHGLYSEFTLAGQFDEEVEVLPSWSELTEDDLGAYLWSGALDQLLLFMPRTTCTFDPRQEVTVSGECEE